MSTERAIPTLFHRRLVLLASVMLFVVAILALQLARLSVVEGAEWLRRAETPLVQQTLLPTYRGTIRDRVGRVLAIDRPGYAVAVEYDVITGDWVRRRSREQARRRTGRARWDAMGDEERDAAAAEHTGEWQQHVDRLRFELRRHGNLDDAALDDRLERVRRDVEDLAERVWARQRAAELEEVGGAPEDLVFRPRPIREQVQAHVILPDVSDDVAFAFRSLAAELPAGLLEVQDARRRIYPLLTRSVPVDRTTLPRPLATDRSLDIEVQGLADHILGSMREVQAEDLARRPFRHDDGTIDLGGYRRIGDTSGARGLERALEDHLRGTRGISRRRLDSDVVERIDPAPGRDLTLTIDIMLQARVQAALSDEIGLTTVQPYHQNAETLPVGWPLNGSVAVVEIESGEIMALVSMPTRAIGERVARIDPMRNAIDTPWVNRAVEAVYPPGSIIKPLVLAAAMANGLYDADETIECTGHYFPKVTTHARCWIYRERWDFATHGPLRGDEALAQSCNIFFYTLAERLGPDGMTRWLRRFGLGAPLDVGLLHTIVDPATGDRRTVGEEGGLLLGDPALAAILRGDHRFDTISMGIGQGPCVTWTAIQAANAYAMLARGGSVRPASLLADDPRGTRMPTEPDVELAPEIVQTALDGLAGSVSAGGTGHHLTFDGDDRQPIFTAEQVTVWGKTGTAQAPPLRVADTDGDGTITSRDEGIAGLDHSWFVGLVGPRGAGPMYAIAVIVEYGGSGGRVAGPIANQVIVALQAEDYLPGVPALVRPIQEGPTWRPAP